MNAKEELLEALDGKKVIAATISYRPYPFGPSLVVSIPFGQSKEFRLKKNHSDKEWESFLNALDFKYDASYGAQGLFGTVWLDDGLWLERGEYDGSEWWELPELPEIPEELK